MVLHSDNRATRPFFLFRLIHTERDLNSKRVLIENYKSQLEIQATRVNEKSSNEVKRILFNHFSWIIFFFIDQQNDERLKNLTDMNEKLRTSVGDLSIHRSLCFSSTIDLDRLLQKPSPSRDTWQTWFGSSVQSISRWTDEIGIET